ncbi:unnamed protein product [Amoebophrya sp. A120]|nr:unnamed protein product [Amoebophrya sp. A120]|eukprot:GSA120T00001915001.1
MGQGGSSDAGPDELVLSEADFDFGAPLGANTAWRAARLRKTGEAFAVRSVDIAKTRQQLQASCTSSSCSSPGSSNKVSLETLLGNAYRQHYQAREPSLVRQACCFLSDDEKTLLCVAELAAVGAVRCTTDEKAIGCFFDIATGLHSLRSRKASVRTDLDPAQHVLLDRSSKNGRERAKLLAFSASCEKMTSEEAVAPSLGVSSRGDGEDKETASSHQISIIDTRDKEFLVRLFDFLRPLEGAPAAEAAARRHDAGADELRSFLHGDSSETWGALLGHPKNSLFADAAQELQEDDVESQTSRSTFDDLLARAPRAEIIISRVLTTTKLISEDLVHSPHSKPSSLELSPMRRPKNESMSLKTALRLSPSPNRRHQTSSRRHVARRDTADDDFQSVASEEAQTPASGACASGDIEQKRRTSTTGGEHPPPAGDLNRAAEVDLVNYNSPELIDITFSSQDVFASARQSLEICPPSSASAQNRETRSDKNNCARQSDSDLVRQAVTKIDAASSSSSVACSATATLLTGDQPAAEHQQDDPFGLDQPLLADDKAAVQAQPSTSMEDGDAARMHGSRSPAPGPPQAQHQVVPKLAVQLRACSGGSSLAVPIRQGQEAEQDKNLELSQQEEEPKTARFGRSNEDDFCMNMRNLTEMKERRESPSSSDDTPGFSTSHDDDSGRSSPPIRPTSLISPVEPIGAALRSPFEEVEVGTHQGVGGTRSSVVQDESQPLIAQEAEIRPSSRTTSSLLGSKTAPPPEGLHEGIKEVDLAAAGEQTATTAGPQDSRTSASSNSSRVRSLVAMFSSQLQAGGSSSSGGGAHAVAAVARSPNAKMKRMSPLKSKAAMRQKQQANKRTQLADDFGLDDVDYDDDATLHHADVASARAEGADDAVQLHGRPHPAGVPDAEPQRPSCRVVRDNIIKRGINEEATSGLASRKHSARMEALARMSVEDAAASILYDGSPASPALDDLEGVQQEVEDQAHINSSSLLETSTHSPRSATQDSLRIRSTKPKINTSAPSTAGAAGIIMVHPPGEGVETTRTPRTLYGGEQPETLREVEEKSNIRPGSKSVNASIIRSALGAISDLREKFRASPPGTRHDVAAGSATRTQRAWTTNAIEDDATTSAQEQENENLRSYSVKMPPREFAAAASRIKSGKISEKNNVTAAVLFCSPDEPIAEQGDQHARGNTNRLEGSSGCYTVDQSVSYKPVLAERRAETEATRDVNPSSATKKRLMQKSGLQRFSPKKRTPTKPRSPAKSGRTTPAINTRGGGNPAPSRSRKNPFLSFSMNGRGGVSASMMSMRARAEAASVPRPKNVVSPLQKAAGVEVTSSQSRKNHSCTSTSLTSGSVVTSKERKAVAASAAPGASPAGGGTPSKTNKRSQTSAPRVQERSGTSAVKKSPPKKKHIYRPASRISQNNETADSPDQLPQSSEKKRNFVNQNRRGAGAPSGSSNLLGTPREFKPVLTNRRISESSRTSDDKKASDMPVAEKEKSSDQQDDALPVSALTACATTTSTRSAKNATGGSKGRDRTPVRALQDFWNQKVSEIHDKKEAVRSRQQELVQRGKERAHSVREQMQRSVSPRATTGGAADSTTTTVRKAAGASSITVPSSSTVAAPRSFSINQNAQQRPVSATESAIVRPRNSREQDQHGTKNLQPLVGKITPLRQSAADKNVYRKRAPGGTTSSAPGASISSAEDRSKKATPTSRSGHVTPQMMQRPVGDGAATSSTSPRTIVASTPKTSKATEVADTNPRSTPEFAAPRLFPVEDGSSVRQQGSKSKSVCSVEESKSIMSDGCLSFGVAVDVPGTTSSGSGERSTKTRSKPNANAEDVVVTAKPLVTTATAPSAAAPHPSTSSSSKPKTVFGSPVLASSSPVTASGTSTLVASPGGVAPTGGPPVGGTLSRFPFPHKIASPVLGADHPYSIMSSSIDRGGKNTESSGVGETSTCANPVTGRAVVSSSPVLQAAAPGVHPSTSSSSTARSMSAAGYIRAITPATAILATRTAHSGVNTPTTSVNAHNSAASSSRRLVGVGQTVPAPTALSYFPPPSTTSTRTESKTGGIVRDGSASTPTYYKTFPANGSSSIGGTTTTSQAPPASSPLSMHGNKGAAAALGGSASVMVQRPVTTPVATSTANTPSVATPILASVPRIASPLEVGHLVSHQQGRGQHLAASSSAQACSQHLQPRTPGKTQTWSNNFQLKCPTSSPKKPLAVPKSFHHQMVPQPAAQVVPSTAMTGPAGVGPSSRSCSSSSVVVSTTSTNPFQAKLKNHVAKTQHLIKVVPPGGIGGGAATTSSSSSSKMKSPATATHQQQSVFPSPDQLQPQPGDRLVVEVAQKSLSEENSHSVSTALSQQQPSPGDFTNSLLNRLNFYQSPNTLKDFDVLETIGQGTSGHLYKVRPRPSFTPSPAFFSAGKGNPDLYALKIIRKSKVKQLRMQDFLLREIEVHSVLDHPHVLKFYDYFTDDRKIYLLLELCDVDLYAKLQERLTGTNGASAFSEREAAEFMYQICDGFTYLHENSVLHGDIKLENILVGRDGLVKIADFGTVCKSVSLKRSTFCGTLDYLAPEIVQHRREYEGNLTDVWALGIMLYELLLGKPPFEDESTEKTCKRILRKEPKFPIDKRIMSDACASLISQMLVKDPARRIQLRDVRTSPFFQMHLGRG